MFDPTARVTVARLSTIGVGAMLPIYCCWCRLLHYGEDKCYPFFDRWCRRYSAHFNAVGTTVYTKARGNAAHFGAVVVGVILSILLLLVPPFTQRRGYILPVLRLLVEVLCCPFYCCWCRLLHYGEGKCCPFFSRWCRCYAAHFTAVGVGVTRPKMSAAIWRERGRSRS